MKRKITIGILAIIALVIAYNLISQIISAVKSGERLTSLADTVYRLENRNNQLRQKLADVQSTEFIEQQARDKLGLGKKGETIVIIPDDKLKLVLGASSSSQEIRLPNWLGWFRVFFK